MKNIRLLKDPYYIPCLLLGIGCGFFISLFAYQAYYYEMNTDSTILLGGLFLFCFPLLMSVSLLFILIMATQTGKYTSVVAFSLFFSLFVLMITIPSNNFYKGVFISAAYENVNTKILESNQGKEPQTALYKQFKQDKALNDSSKLLEYNKPVIMNDLISTSKENIYLLKLSGESLKNPVLKEKYKEIIADKFVSEQEYQTFKNLVVSIEIDEIFPNKLTFKERKND